VTYIEFINRTIREIVLPHENIVLFGQNITTGSCLSGLTKELEVSGNSKIINTPNSENTLVGTGFGLMLNGTNAVFFMKQLDFLYLGIDQLTNTYNYIKTIDVNASFTIVPIIVDSGYEGMMASTNNLSDFCAISKIHGYTVTNKYDAKYILNHFLVSPGFRIIGISQRLFRQPLLLESADYEYSANDGIVEYENGNDLTIVSFNLSFPEACNLSLKFKRKGLSASLFSVNRSMSGDYSSIIDDVKNTKNIVVIDDSWSDNKLFNELLITIYEIVDIEIVKKVTRYIDENNYAPNANIFKIDYDDIVNGFL
jgi:pyruvate/2-oxoglutarate/acetoin dehydrogenase E1 component